jgi:hypothetical protein
MANLRLILILLLGKSSVSQRLKPVQLPTAFVGWLPLLIAFLSKDYLQPNGAS